LFDAALSIAPLKDVHGEIIGFSAIVQDISQHKMMERQIVEIGIEERQKIGQTLHDRLGQMLTGVSLMARAVKQKFGGLHHEIPGIAGEMQTIINEAIELTRSLSRGLMPIDVVNSTLEDALLELMELTERIYGVHCTVDVSMATDTLDGLVSTQLYYIAQESVRNAVIHGNAGSVNISLKGSDNRFSLLVTDDGTGLQRPEMQSAGIGMKIMEYRANMIGAGISYTSMEKGGCVVCCSFIG
jgi:signal transduction histidine kinase